VDAIKIKGLENVFNEIEILHEQTTSPATWQQCNRTGKPQTVHKPYITTECPENCY
jgi:hypothetical protein